MNLKGIIFDIDGTLTDSLPICIEAFTTAVESCTGRRITDADVTRQFGASEEGIMAELVPEKPEAGLKEYLSAYKRLCDESLPCVEGLDMLLKTLRDHGLKLAVVTGKGKPSTDMTLDQLAIGDFFDSVVCGSPNGGVKAESIKKVANAWGFEPDEVAYVGDVESDVQASLDAGVVPVLATWIYQSGSSFIPDCHVFSDVDTFLDWVTNRSLS